MRAPRVDCERRGPSASVEGMIDMETLLNTDLGPYRLVELVRRGGMATVYKAYQPSLNRFVAIKILEHHHDRQLVERFKAEAQLVAQLQHPNILQVYDYGEQNGLLFLTTQYVEGGASLADLGKPMSLAAALALTERLLSALEYAHARGIVHRDVKPSNVLLPAPDWPLLADFGIAKLLDHTGNDLTAAGQVIGTAAYMAPEQAAGELVDARTDLYAVGALLYELVTGQVPFGTSPRSVVLARLTSEPPPPPRSLNPTIPAAVEPILLRALAKRPDQRYHSARIMAADLERLAAQEGHLIEGVTVAATQAAPAAATRRPRWALAALALVLLVVLGGAAVMAWRGGAPIGTTPTAGRVAWRDKVLRNDLVIVSAEGLPPPEAGQVYAAWLSGGKGGLALGVLKPGDDGKLIVFYTSPDQVNLLGNYHRVSITKVPEAAAQTEPANVILTGALPKDPLVHLRHVLFRFDETPNKIGFAPGLRQEADTLLAHAHLLKKSYDAGRLEGAKRHAEHLIGIIEGADGEHIGDLDGDGQVENPGDGFGMLQNGQQVGYIAGMVGHAQLAAAAANATKDTKTHAASVQTIGATVQARVTDIRDRALRIGQASDLATTQQDVITILELATHTVEGVDSNGNGQVEPIPDEGGVMTAYEHAQLMADMWLAPADDQEP
jgi:tRNA A-37 threonylcarbamoyl transferase component Bud32